MYSRITLSRRIRLKHTQILQGPFQTNWYLIKVYGGIFNQIIAQSLEHDWCDATGTFASIKRCFHAAKHVYIGRDSQDGTPIAASSLSQSVEERSLIT